MAVTVAISIVGRTYEISCDDGQQDYIRTLAGDIDRRAAELLRSVGQVGDTRLLVMVALLLADELTELRRKNGSDGDVVDGAADAALAESIDALADRIDAIADRLERA
jgi:cell division protein ZapA